MQKQKLNRDYLRLRMSELKAAGLTNRGERHHVGLWNDGRGGKVELRLAVLRLGKRSGRLRVVGEEIDTELALAAYKTPTGGLTYYLVCPECEKRRSYLCLVDSTREFRCRKCFGVLYPCRALRRHSAFDGVIRPIRILGRFRARYEAAKSPRLRRLILVEALRAERRLAGVLEGLSAAGVRRRL